MVSDGEVNPCSLPPELGTIFHIRDADRLGVTRRRLSAHDVSAPFPGVRRIEDGVPLESVRDRCLAYLPRMIGGQFFSHETAAVLWGMPLPFRHGQALHVSAPPPLREPRTRNVVGHRLSMPQDGVTLVDDLPVATRVETWGMLGATLHWEDLVAVGDWLLAEGVSSSDLSDVASRARRRGAAALRHALEFVRPGAESPRETAVRLILVQAGLPEPELNWTLRTGGGAFVARLDMAYPGHRVAVEYDGRRHADPDQFRRDADRWRAISAEGWTLVRVLAHHLATPGHDIVTPVRRALDTARLR